MAYAGWTRAAIAIMLLARTTDIATMVAIILAWYLVGSIVWVRLRQGHRGIARRGME